MQRKIKFRGKQLNNGKWHYGYFLVNSFGEATIINITTTEQGGIGACVVSLKVDIKTVGQFAGLHDKNEKEIYEGDVLATSNNGKDGCDIWNEKTFGYTQVIWDAASSRFRGTKWTWGVGEIDSVYDLNYVEIIGNIYENPELL